jgi:hypothetical protein
MAEKKEDSWMNVNGQENKTARAQACCSGKFFEIRVKGHLNSLWSEWLDSLEIKLLDNGEMILLGPIVDQAALMGILNKLSRLNLALLSVNGIEIKERNEQK